MSSNESLSVELVQKLPNLVPEQDVQALRIAALDVEPQSRTSETVASNALSPTPPLIQRAFDTFLSLEPDADWQIDVDKLHAFLSTYHQHNRSVSLSETRSIMELADLDRNGRLSFSEFHSVYACLSIIRDLFGVHTAKELKPLHVKQALLHAGLEPRGAQIERMFQLGDEVKAKEHRGETSALDFVEFLRIFLHTPRSTPGHVFLHSWYSAGRNSTPYNMPVQDVSPSQDFMAGTMAGVALTLVGHPFDTVKVRLQTQSSFQSGWQCVKETLRNENVLSFFKGMGGPMATIPLTNAIVFGAYSQGKQLIYKLRGEGQQKPLSMWQVGLAGSYAGLLSCAVACPVELVKTRLQIQYTQTDKEPFKGPLDCVRAIYKRRGIKGLFRGMSATIYREVPGYGGQFFTYEALKQTFAKRDGRKLDELGPIPLILSGGTAGICGWCLSYPMDFVKSQIQAEPYQTKTPWRKHPILLDGGFFDCFRYTVRQHGFRALWRGFGPCVARAFPANAAGFVAYEWTMKALRSIDTEDAVL